VAGAVAVAIAAAQAERLRNDGAQPGRLLV
jgi:hypothetical protein